MPINHPLPEPLSKQNTVHDSDIAGYLASFYASPSLGSIAKFLYLNNFNTEDFKLHVGDAEGFAGQPFPVDKFSRYDNSVALNLISLKPLEECLPFEGDGEPFHVFVELGTLRRYGPVPPQQEYFSLLLPYQTAAVLSAAVRNGLATRLILERYRRKWGTLNVAINLVITSAGIFPTPPPFPGASWPPTAGAWVTNYLSNLTQTMTSKDNWQAGDYVTALSALTDPLLPGVGLLLGWVAGDALVQSADDYNNCEPKFWQWINSKFTTRDLGMIVGSTFCYLSGFLRCERTVDLIAGNGDKGQADAGGILANLARHSYRSTHVRPCDQDPVFKVANGFFELVVAEFYVTQNTNTEGGLVNYQAFINGFEEGLALGAEAMFASAFEKGYTLGYLSGFRDGYSLGYAAGYKAGYAAGYAAGQPSWITDLNKVMSDIGTLVGDAKTVTSILGDATTVGTVLTAIF